MVKSKIFISAMLVFVLAPASFAQVLDQNSPLCDEVNANFRGMTRDQNQSLGAVFLDSQVYVVKNMTIQQVQSKLDGYASKNGFRPFGDWSNSRGYKNTAIVRDYVKYFGTGPTCDPCNSDYQDPGRQIFYHLSFFIQSSKSSIKRAFCHVIWRG